MSFDSVLLVLDRIKVGVSRDWGMCARWQAWIV